MTTSPSATTDPPDLPDGTKVKRRVERQRACNEPGKNNNICRGHLKRWFDFDEEVEQEFGPNVEIYRCERCGTLYLPNKEETPRTQILAF